MKHIRLMFDESTLRVYEKHYFSIHPKEKKAPIRRPYH